MAEVAVTINGRVYQMACDDGQEEHLLALSQQVGSRVDELANSVGQVGDARLLVMTSLLIADELFDLRAEVDELRAEAERHIADLEERLAGRLESLAARLEDVADAMEAH
ncbi:MAG: cell division protein ZapA [Alphaproteobacteria bacterium]